MLKSPFCVHPKTGRVCVPINPAKADDFDPMDVPTVVDLLEERRAYESSSSNVGSAFDNNDDADSDEDVPRSTAGAADDADADAMDTSSGRKRLAEYKKTSMKGYMNIFNSFLKKLEDSQRQQRARQRDDSLTF